MRNKSIVASFASVMVVAIVAGCGNDGETNETNQNHDGENETADQELDSEMKENQEEEKHSESVNNDSDNENESEEERNEAYYESLAVTDDTREVAPEAIEHLELPGIHENTRIYNGTVSPGQMVRFVFPDDEHESGFNYQNALDPHVSDEGHFSVSFSNYDLNDMEQIRFIVSGFLPQEQAFDLPIHPEEEGMAYIPSEADTEELEAAVQEEVELDDIYENTRFYHVQHVVEDVDAVHLEHPEIGFSEDLNLPAADVELENTISTSFDENVLTAGDTLTFYIVAKGVTTLVEKDVQGWTDEEWAVINTIKNETSIDEIVATEPIIVGKTVPHASITITNLNPRNFNTTIEADEEGQFEMDLSGSRDEMDGEAILFSIVDEEGHLATMEVPVQE
ncbi:hypothetical protein ACE1TH_06795 [Shouchella sp. JSM 1781072]|uniref:hypothetical protein n=1 Tax=Shouchella sp. JSM 1781072 TaxID=3344581 RepID=UPI0035BF6307